MRLFQKFAFASAMLAGIAGTGLIGAKADESNAQATQEVKIEHAKTLAACVRPQFDILDSAGGTVEDGQRVINQCAAQILGIGFSTIPTDRPALIKFMRENFDFPTYTNAVSKPKPRFEHL